jgi:TPR repeat protein
LEPIFWSYAQLIFAGELTMKRILTGLILLFIALATPSWADDLGDIIAAAKDNNVQAQIALGAMYEHGMGVALNDRLSAYWWQRAVDNGHTGIAKALGSMYFSGRGVPHDYAKAMELYMIAAEDDHPHAIKYIALGYQRGLGLPQDDAKAAEWKARGEKLLGPDAAVVFIDSYQSEETEPQTEIEIFEEFKRQADK